MFVKTDFRRSFIMEMQCNYFYARNNMETLVTSFFFLKENVFCMKNIYEKRF